MSIVSQSISMYFDQTYLSLNYLTSTERGKYFVDFKNGEGDVGQGDPQHKPGYIRENFSKIKSINF